MTLLYGKDANGNQVPLLVSANGTVQTSGLWSGTSSQLTAGDGSAVTVGSGLTLAGGTLSASSGGGWTTAYSVDFKAQPTDAGPWGTVGTTTTRTIDGKTWSVINGGTNLGASLTNGVGLRFQPAVSSGPCWLIIQTSSLLSTITKQIRFLARMKFASNSDTTSSDSFANLFLQYDGLPITTANRVAVGFEQDSTSRRASFQSFGSGLPSARTNGVSQPASSADNMFSVEVNGPEYWLYQGPSAGWNGNPNIDMNNVFQGATNTNAVWGVNPFTNLSTCAVGFYIERAAASVSFTATIENLIIQTL
jgi:hypothetical protein